jgi:hypothetical protein
LSALIIQQRAWSSEGHGRDRDSIARRPSFDRVLYASGRIAGLLCLGYPFHPLGKPDQLRTEHLASLKTPTLIAQGTRDRFGSREEGVDLSFRRTSRSSGWRTATMSSNRERAYPVFQRPIT